MVQMEGTAESDARAPDMPQIGQSCDASAPSAGKRQSDDMTQEPKRLKRATEAIGSAHTASAMPGDSAEGPRPTSPDTNAQQALPEASLPASATHASNHDFRQRGAVARGGRSRPR